MASIEQAAIFEFFKTTGFGVKIAHFLPNVNNKKHLFLA